MNRRTIYTDRHVVLSRAEDDDGFDIGYTLHALSGPYDCPQWGDEGDLVESLLAIIEALP